MKKLLAMLFVLPSIALAAPATVIDVEPVTRVRSVYQPVTEYQYTCNIVHERSGAIESVTGSIFGSNDGAIGALIGYGIGSQIGKGHGNDVAKVAGVVIGNSVGNNHARRSREECREVPVTKRVRHEEHYISHYNIDVDINGFVHTVQRNYAPTVGSTIDVSVSVR